MNCHKFNNGLQIILISYNQYIPFTIPILVMVNSTINGDKNQVYYIQILNFTIQDISQGNKDLILFTFNR